MSGVRVSEVTICHHIKAFTVFNIQDHKLADAMKLVDKIVFNRNTAPFSSTTTAQKQFQILLPCLKVQIKANITYCFFPCLLRHVSKFLLEKPCIMWAGIYSNSFLIDACRLIRLSEHFLTCKKRRIFLS